MSRLTPRQHVRRGLQHHGWTAEARRRAHEERLRLGERLFATSRTAERTPLMDVSPPRTSLVASAVGRIERILVTVPPNRDFATGEPYEDSVDERIAMHFRTLIWALGADRRYVVVCQPRQERAVRGWFDEHNVSESNYEIVFSVYDYTIWAQDAFVVLTDEDGRPSLCEGVRFNRYDDMVIADDVAAQTEIGHLHSILEFQGGNILGDPQGHLIGIDYIHGNLGRVGLENDARIARTFEQLLGGPVRPVGLGYELPDSERRGGLEGSRQPVFHIDMYITLTGVEKEGRQVAVVASPRRAREVLGQPARPADQDLYFDQAAQQLSQWYHVERLPFLPLWGRIFEWDPSYYALTWNNVVIENYVDASGVHHGNVYMPTYGETDEASRQLGVDPAPRRDLDNEAERVWSEVLGFNAIRSDGLEDLAYGRGAVHCITKVLQRSPPALTGA